MGCNMVRPGGGSPAGAVGSSFVQPSTLQRFGPMRLRAMAQRATLAIAGRALGGAVSSQEVGRIEPPSWGVEGDEQSVMLLVEGTNLGGAEARATYGAIRIGRVEPGHEGRAVFVELTVPGGCEPQRCEIE